MEIIKATLRDTSYQNTSATRWSSHAANAKNVFITFLLIFLFSTAFSQSIQRFKTWTPAADTVQALQGQGWPTKVANYYDRLPAYAQQTVRKEVWNLGKESAGLQLRFKTDAQEIRVKYTVGGSLQMPHMPATGVSGVDLYARNNRGDWLWAAGNYAFGDTIVFRFQGLNNKDATPTALDYVLYLPLYNTVTSMQISVPEQATFKPTPLPVEKPIVVYGTSIAQGACASRPGLAWTNILGRKTGLPIINLGFSGNGRLEPAVIKLLTEIDAAVYVLDCLPNLTSPGDITPDELKKRIVSSVQQLQAQRPATPILLTDHDGYTDEAINPTRRKSYQDVNTVLGQALDSLRALGLKHIFHLSKKEINQDIESTVDGTHPNDTGMLHYAEAYEKKINKILSKNR